jgi:hypothetical protein
LTRWKTKKKGRRRKKEEEEEDNFDLNIDLHIKKKK